MSKSGWIAAATRTHEYIPLEHVDKDDDTTFGEARMSYEEQDRDKTSVRDTDALEPTEVELKTLRRVSGKIPWAAYSLAFVELCERFSWYGTTAVCE
jgi:hypothetical protein